MSSLKSEPGRSELALLMQNVPAAEHAKAVAFLALGRDRLRRAWKVVSGGDVHVLVLGADEPATIPGLLDDPVSTLQLGNGPATGQHPLLTRPLQYDDFIEALQAAEDVLLGEAPAAPRRTTHPIEPSPAIPAPEAASGQPFAFSPGAVYRLRRWPPSRLLLGHRYHARLAGFLSVRHAGVDELARLSNVDTAACEAFLAALGAAGLLDTRTAPPPAATAPAPSPAAASAVRTVPGPAPAVPPGLFQKLRRRLGLDATKP